MANSKKEVSFGLLYGSTSRPIRDADWWPGVRERSKELEDWWVYWGYEKKPYCANCGEPITLFDQQNGNAAEVYTPSFPELDSKLIHWECRRPGEEIA